MYKFFSCVAICSLPCKLVRTLTRTSRTGLNNLPAAHALKPGQNKVFGAYYLAICALPCTRSYKLALNNSPFSKFGNRWLPLDPTVLPLTLSFCHRAPLEGLIIGGMPAVAPFLIHQAQKRP